MALPAMCRKYSEKYMNPNVIILCQAAGPPTAVGILKAEPKSSQQRFRIALDARWFAYVRHGNSKRASFEDVRCGRVLWSICGFSTLLERSELFSSFALFAFAF